MRRLTALAASAAVLAACAHAPARSVSDGLDFAQRQARLESVKAWDMRGRLVVDTGERGFQGSFDWQQHPDTLRLRVRGPLGAGLLEVAGPLDHLVVTARGEHREITDPETELSALLGWWLPVESLQDWLLGLPDPRYPARTTFDRAGALAALEQREWRVAYPRYQLADGLLLPQRIELRHAGLELELAVDSWLASTP